MKKALLMFLSLILAFSFAACKKQGEQGLPGKDGINGVDGQDGKDGKDGKDGVDGITPTIEISEDGYWIINGVKTEYKAIGEDGAPGKDGIDGAPGKDGESGAPGEGGTDGVTPAFKLEGGDIWVSYDGGASWESLGNVNASICHHRDVNDDYRCDKCGNPYSDGVDLPADPDHTHDFGPWKYYSANFDYCDEALYYRTCSGCNVIEWRDGSEDDHNYDTVTTPPTCTEPGFDTKTCHICGKIVECNETAIVPHTFPDYYKFDASYHWKQCTYCSEITDHAEHTLDENSICILCNQPLAPTPGVMYDKSLDGTYAEVIGYNGTATQIVITDTYNGLPVKSIRSDVFYGNDSIVSIVIPDSVTEIQPRAFYDCDNLKTVMIGNGVTTIGERVFFNCKNLASVTIGSGVTFIDTWAFYDCNALTSVYITDIAAWCNIEFYSTTSNPLHYGGSLYLNDQIVTDLIIPDGVNKIGNYAFYNYQRLASVIIGNDVVEIGSNAFYNCQKLESIVIPDSVTKIGHNAFYSCSQLSSVTINSGVLIGEDAFANCHESLYTEYEYGRYIGDNNNPYAALIALVYNEFTTYAIHDSTYSIGDYVFKECIRLTEITIHDGVEVIGNYAFYGCPNLKTVVIGDGVTVIGDSAFRDCDLLENVTIGKGVKTIGYEAFEYCSALKSIVIPGNVTTIGTYAFRECRELETVVIENGVKEIGQSAFSRCGKIKNIIIPDSVTVIHPDAFFYCSGLQKIVIGSGINTIADNAFGYCSDILWVYYNGTADDWADVSAGTNNDYFTRYIHYYSETEPAESGKYWHYDQNGEIAVW